MKEAEKKFINFLKAGGMKFTPERKIVLNEVLLLHRHFDTEELFQTLYKKRKRVSRASVYRILPLLVEAGLTAETPLRRRDKTNYEYIFGHGHHDHMLCLDCGGAIEFYDDRIENLANEICRKYGFKAVERRLGIKGYCRACRKKLKSRI
ncbi:MAG: Fur family transcriptional regulator [bacterium]